MSDDANDDDGEIPFVTDNDDNNSSANHGNMIAEEEDIANITLLRNRGSIDDATDDDDFVFF
jgi:hypothetical protein